MRHGHLLVLMMASLSFTDVFAGQPTLPIRKATTQQLGSQVTVSGSVTVTPGTFSSSSGDQGFGLQDQTGGIWISLQNRMNLRRGQKVKVTGVLGQSYGKLQVVPSSSAEVYTLHEGSLVVKTGDVGESTLGYIVALEGTITDKGVTPDPPYGSIVYLDDGSGPAKVYLNASTNINPGADYLRAGSKLRVIGFGNQFGSAYEIDPRSRRDLVRIK